jgi:hypothetical protein
MAYTANKARARKVFKTAGPKMQAALKLSGSRNEREALEGLRQVAKVVALTLPLKQGVPDGDIATDIYEEVPLPDGVAPEFPLDFAGSDFAPTAYTIPGTGRIPEFNVEGDYVMVTTYEIGASIDWPLKYARHARWDVVSRCMTWLESMFVRKVNTDGWQTIISAGAARNLVAYDDTAVAGLLTKRVVSLGKTLMRRNAGGNSASTSRGKLTHLYMSPEAMEDIRSWDLSQVDDITRRQIFLSDGDSALSTIFGVVLRDIDELGENQEFQTYFTGLGGTLPTDKKELMVGLDLSTNDSFVMPTRGDLDVTEDTALHRRRRAGVYAWKEMGFGVLDNRRVILLAA